MEYEPVIGLEVHAQLLTESKMFCACSADYAGAPPNTHVCPVCLGMPGVLPVINQTAVEYTVMTALALNCEIPEFSKFDRKNYPYPDLVKGYQISQYDMPLCHDGWLEVEVGRARSDRVGITRVHLEEDTAKLLHVTDADGQTYSLVDVNRAGVPLMEIVSEPDIRSPAEARAYLIKLRAILQALGVSTGNMEEGSFRCDANVSIRPSGQRQARHQGRSEEHELLPRRAAGAGVRDRAPGGGAGAGRPDRPGDPRLGGGPGRHRQPALQGVRPRLPLLPGAGPAAAGAEPRVGGGVRARLPELPDARRDRFVSAVRPAATTMPTVLTEQPRHGRLLRGDRGDLPATQGRGQLDAGRAVPPAEGRRGRRERHEADARDAGRAAGAGGRRDASTPAPARKCSRRCSPPARAPRPS